VLVTINTIFRAGSIEFEDIRVFIYTFPITWFIVVCVYLVLYIDSGFVPKLLTFIIDSVRRSHGLEDGVLRLKE
jgi:hypothetical protein